MLLTLLLDPNSSARYYRLAQAVGWIGLALLLLWVWRLFVLCSLTLAVLKLVLWSINRLAEESKNSNPRESVVWLGLGGIILALAVLVVGYKWLPFLLLLG